MQRTESSTTSPIYSFEPVTATTDSLIALANSIGTNAKAWRQATAELCTFAGRTTIQIATAAKDAAFQTFGSKPALEIAGLLFPPLGVCLLVRKAVTIDYVGLCRQVIEYKFGIDPQNPSSKEIDYDERFSYGRTISYTAGEKPLNNSTVLFVNGMMNDKLEGQPEYLSELSGANVQVRGIYNPSHGIVGDCLEYVLQRFFGCVTNPVAAVMAELEGHFEQFPDGRILVVAHSQGAAITIQALRHYKNREDLKRVDLLFVAPGQFATPDLQLGVGSIQHVCSTADPVAQYADQTGGDECIDSTLWWPPAEGANSRFDHDFDSPTFRPTIEAYLQTFLRINGELTGDDLRPESGTITRRQRVRQREQ